MSFSRGQGVYVGLNLDGTVVSVSDDCNELYYGQRVNAVDILVQQERSQKELLNVIARVAGNSTRQTLVSGSHDGARDSVARHHESESLMQRADEVIP